MYTETGSFLRSFGSYGSGAGELGGAVRLAVDGAGNAIVADTYNHRVDVFDYLFPTVAPPVVPSGAPTGLTAVPGAWEITLTWNPVERADGYNIYADGTLVQQVGSLLLSTPVAAHPGKPTRYEVAAFSQGVESARSASVTATATDFPQPPVDPQPPTDPTDPAVAAPAKPKLKKVTGTTVTVTLPKAPKGTALALYVRAANGTRVKVKGKPNRKGKLTVKRLKATPAMS